MLKFEISLEQKLMKHYITFKITCSLDAQIKINLFFGVSHSLKNV